MRAALAVALVLAATAACTGDDEDSTARSTTTTTVAGSAGCTGEEQASPGEERITLDDGRWFIRRVPPAAADRDTPLPLVMDLHGYAEGAEVHVRFSGLPAYGEEQGFVTVTPQGEGVVPHWAATIGSPDVAFLESVLDHTEEAVCIDRDRVFVTGMSNGAFMTSVLACSLADRVAAVAPVAGVRAVDGCEPARPVPMVAFHGTEDRFVAFEGGLGEAVADLPAPGGSERLLGELGVRPRGGTDPSVPEIMAGWAELDGCEPTPEEEPVAEDVTLVTFPCPDPVEVQLYRIEGGGHTWPGSELAARFESLIGTTTMSISANEIMWEFFGRHPLPS